MSQPEFVLPWLWAFLFTQAVEVPIYLRAFSARLEGVALWRRLLIAFGASLLTHPIVWFVIPMLIGMHPYSRWVLMAVVAEAFAVGVEALYLYLCGVPRAFVWALAANGMSLGLGLVSRHFFQWP
jgi:hypothetical protein